MTTASVNIEPITLKAALLSSLPIRSVDRSIEARGKTSAHQPICQVVRAQGRSGQQSAAGVEVDGARLTLNGRTPSRQRTHRLPHATNMNQICEDVALSSQLRSTSFRRKGGRDPHPGPRGGSLSREGSARVSAHRISRGKGRGRHTCADADAPQRPPGHGLACADALVGAAVGEQREQVDRDGPELEDRNCEARGDMISLRLADRRGRAARGTNSRRVHLMSAVKEDAGQCGSAGGKGGSRDAQGPSGRKLEMMVSSATGEKGGISRVSPHITSPEGARRSDALGGMWWKMRRWR